MSRQRPTRATPAVAGPEGTPGTAEQAEQAEIDWQKRYQHLQPEYTRVTQENAELRRQQELYDAAALHRRRGHSTRDRRSSSATCSTTRRPPVRRAGRGPARAVRRAARTGRAAADRTRPGERRGRLRRAGAGRSSTSSSTQLELDQDDQDWVLAYAINALPITEEGLPDIEQAHQVFAARETERQRNWAQTKRAPRISPHGQPATEVPNLDDRQERQDCIVRRMLENEQAVLTTSGRGRNPFPIGDTAMPQTAVSMASALKEAWTADRLQKQFEDKNAAARQARGDASGIMIGKQAQTPVWGGRSGAFTSRRRRRRRPEPGAAAAGRAGAVDARLQLVPDRARRVGARAGVRPERAVDRRRQGPRDRGRASRTPSTR